ncbi:hypothetical protein P8452_68820 [Trifolium repens]|nr:hypothetical protein P8452_68820 [Trifolium repens]
MKEMQEGSSKHKQVAYCQLCTGDHPTGHCPPDEEISYMGNQNQQRQAPYQNNSGYQRGGNSNNNQGWRQDAGSSNRQKQYEMLRNLETQIGQIAKQVANKNDQGGSSSFNANTTTNPKEHCKSITTRSGKEIGKGIGDNLQTEEAVVEAREKQEGDKKEREGESEENNNEGELVENENQKKMSEESKMKHQKVREKKGESSLKNPPIQNLPYPHINIPFSEALEQMPTYAKFMKEILTKKRKYTDEETIHLDASCSAIIQRTLPTKEKDLGRVTLSVTIGNVNVGKALIDLGSSINLIPLSVTERIGGLDIRRTKMTLQLADKSITRPSGIAEDVLVRVDKFMFPIDFVVMDIEEADDVPLILGRYFIKTARMMIDSDDGIMKVRVQDEKASFNLWEAMKHPKDKGACFKLDATDEAIIDARKQLHKPSSLEDFLKKLDELEGVSPFEEKIEELKDEPRSVDVKLELKTLPSHLKYVFLEEGEKKSVIISSSLSVQEEKSLIQVLKANKEAIG